MSFQRMERPLSDPERRMLWWALARWSREGGARASRSALWASALVCSVLWVLTLLASREPFRIVTDRVISAQAQASLRLPEHVELAPGTLSEVEAVLGAG